MTPDTAQGIWNEQIKHGEGWLDAAARLETERGLTMREKEAADVLWREFMWALNAIGNAFRHLAAVRFDGTIDGNPEP